MKITKTLGKENFDKLYFGKQIPDCYSLNGKDINTRFWIDDCRFLFVKNDQDGLVYCYAQPDISKPAVLISKATEEKALNVFKGTQKFVASINMTSETSELKNILFEMQDQPDFMKMFISATKSAVAQQSVAAQNGIVSSSPANTASAGSTNANNEDYADLINTMIAEGMEMKEEIANLKAKNEELTAERDSLVQKLVDLKKALEDEEEISKLIDGEYQKEIKTLYEEASSYIDQRDELAGQLEEVYKNYQTLGNDFEEIEKAKSEIEKENVELQKQLASLYKDFAKMKNANSRNANCFRHALDEIESLNQTIKMENFIFDGFFKAVEEDRDFSVKRLRAENEVNQNNAKQFADSKIEMYKRNLLSVLKDKNLSQQRLSAVLADFDELNTKYQELEEKYKGDNQQLLEIVEMALDLEEKNKTLTFEKAEKIVAATNENKSKMYELTAKADEKNKEKRIYLAVGPHWEEAQRSDEEETYGKDHSTLYVIEGGDPSAVKDSNDNVMKLQDVLTDPALREIYNIHAVKRIKVDKEHNAQIEYYDTKTTKSLFGKTKEVLKSNYIFEAKDVDAEDLKFWVTEHYDANAEKVKVVSPTFKSQKILKYASIFAGVALVAGTLTFESVRAWGGPNEADAARDFGREQITDFTFRLDLVEKGSLFQYTPALDDAGNELSYVKIVNGEEIAVKGNQVKAIGAASRVFYNNADNKLVIKPYTQQSFWGKLRDYEEETILGAAYQLGAEVVAELSENNVPVYNFEEDSNVKKPLYVYLNFASENKDYSDRSLMVEYLKENGYSAKLAEKITEAYENGFASGLENGLSNKVNEIIGTTDVITPEIPPLSFSDQETKTAIADKLATTTMHGKQYTSDELHVIYSDLDTDGQQVLFVAANKEGSTGVNANKYLYKIVLGDGEEEITSENINEAISNSEEISESVKLEFMFKDQNQFGSAVNKFYSKISEGSVAYVSNYALGQTENGYYVEPTLTVYNANTKTIEVQNSKYVVSVDASQNSSITEMCALALLGDYGYYDQKGIYSVAPTTQSVVAVLYNDNDRELN